MLFQSRHDERIQSSRAQDSRRQLQNPRLGAEPCPGAEPCQEEQDGFRSVRSEFGERRNFGHQMPVTNGLSFTFFDFDFFFF